MCRNITTLRGLEPPATPEEVEAAARQYVRKVSGITHPTPATAEVFERAVLAVAEVTADWSAASRRAGRLRPRSPPPLRRPEFSPAWPRRAPDPTASAHPGPTRAAVAAGCAETGPAAAVPRASLPQG